jgi:arylsulfatase
VLITADALRADHLSVNGYPRETSPNIDRFAGGAWHFSQAVSVIPKTGPSLTTLFTGHHPETHRGRTNFAGVPPGLPLLAERLKGEGYRTAAFVSNPSVRGSVGFARGFDTFQELLEGDGVEAVNAAFLQWASGEWTAPSFVWLHYIDPHGPYEPPPALEALFIDDEWAQSPERVSLDYAAHQVEGGSPNKILGAVPRYQQQGEEDRVAAYVARYDAEIRHMDDAFGEVVGRLQDLGRYDDALVLFTADHGESLGEHDFYFEHGWFAYDATLRVPLMIKRPGQTRGGVVEAQVSLLDIVPSVRDVVGASWEDDGPGGSVFRAPESRPLVLVESAGSYPDKYRGLRSARSKFLTSRESVEELYDLATDPGETVNLASQESEVLAELRRQIPEARAALRSDPSTFAPEIESEDVDPRTREQLRSLGYLE